VILQDYPDQFKAYCWIILTIARQWYSEWSPTSGYLLYKIRIFSRFSLPLQSVAVNGKNKPWRPGSGYHHYSLFIAQCACCQYRAGLRHVRGVRPNRAAKFRAATILDPTKINLPVWTTMIFIWRKLPADTRFDLSINQSINQSISQSINGLAFISPLVAKLTTEPKCCNQMRFASIQYSKMQLYKNRVSAPDPAWGALALPRPHGGAAG